MTICHSERICSDDEYYRQAVDIIHSSNLKYMASSPYAYRARCAGQVNPNSPSMRLGRALHCSVLEPEKFKEQWVEEPYFGDLRSTKARAERDAWLQANGSSEIIDSKEVNKIYRMSASLAPLVESIGPCRKEEGWRVNHGVLTRHVKFDIISDGGVVADVKTTSCLDDFAESVDKYWYAEQAVFYCETALMVVEGAKPKPYDVIAATERFRILAVESVEPYEACMVRLEPWRIGGAYETVQALLQGIEHCVTVNEWPMRPMQII